MSQTPIPFIFMRGGTSRGPYFNRADLPQNLDQLANVLISALGSGHALNIDGIGGGNAVTTKVAMLSRSNLPGADIDYFFAQVSVEDGLVDFKPTCGNILSGVASAAIEMGLHPSSEGETSVAIHAVNTGAEIIAKVQTPRGQISYAGQAAIDGVPGTAAPVELNFMKVAGSSTGAFLPTGNLTDEIDGIPVTCMDVAMPMVIARAADFGLSGYETRDELDKNIVFFQRMEALRIKAGAAMGMGDVTLMAMVGVWLGWQPAVIIFFLATLIGLGHGIFQLVMHRENELPFGPSLCLAAALVTLFWQPVWAWASVLFDDVVQLGTVLGLVVVLTAVTLFLWRWLREKLHSIV